MASGRFGQYVFMVLSFFCFSALCSCEFGMWNLKLLTSLTSSLTRLTSPVGAEQIASTIGWGQGFRPPTEPPKPASAGHFILGQCV